MTRILAIADEVEEALYGDKLYRLHPDLIVSCGDLPFDYLENLVSRANVPLVYVPGNHDPDLRPLIPPAPPLPPPPLPGPPGCDDADGRIIDAAGLRIAGLGGSHRYKLGPNQYTQREMRFRALGLELRLKLRRALGGRGLDVLITHAPPLACGDLEDPAHVGFAAFHGLLERLKPRLMIHGHVHPFGRSMPDRHAGSTLIVNAVPCRVLEI